MIATITARGLTLGTIASGYLIGNTSGFDSPISRVDIQDNGNWHGARLGSYVYGKRLMSVEGQIIGTSASDFELKRRALQKAFSILDGLITVTFVTRGGLSVQADCILNNKIEEAYQKGQAVMCDFRLELASPFPYFLSTTEVTTEVTVISGGGGAVPSAIPFSLATGGAAPIVIANNGNIDAYPTIRIQGIIQNPSIRNMTSGKSLSLVYSLTSSLQYIDLDFYTHTAKLHTGLNISGYVSGDWWTLLSGNNEIKLTASLLGGGGKADVTHRHSYLGL